MTDEEKAIKDLCIKCSSYDFCVKGNQLHCAETVAYIKGLAAGRKLGKEDQWKATEKAQKKTSARIRDLEKENAELKATIDCLQLNLSSTNDTVEELTMQIEKMKCCENCEHNGSDSEIGENGDYTDYTCIQCDDFSTKENPYPNWELAENAELKAVCDYNCPDHKLATHNACLTCPAVRNSPYHDLKNVSDEELQQIIKDAETEMEM